MSERAIREIAQRLSLRAPQREALTTLRAVATALALPTAGADPRAFIPVKNGERDKQLAACRTVAPQLKSFDREFPSFCFALATGVGKTRLMGAQIAYLHRVHGVQHFFVVAPNLTIYDKLRRDFTPNTPKYVFEGLPDFASQPPELITGDDWDTGRGLRGAGGGLWGQDAVHVNLFNVSKFDTQDGSRMRKLHETIGSSYFDYLASLPDLVLLMDESHRYRAKAAATALNDLKPLLGIELTATPQVQQGTRVEPFTNIAYSYKLAAAISDGFVKKPAVAGRLNLDTVAADQDQMDRMKLEDALVLHEKVKAELIAYADRENVHRVKPFVLVIARDTTHAEQLEALIASTGFHNGLYAGRVITVHSNRNGAEKDEVIQRLLRVEDASEPTEVVIHVEMLKEGWDVTNLYTVVPLRAANSRTLVEQSIGRGLRLPYGRQTGVAEVDRLTIVAHDKFNEIVAESERGDSPFKIEQIVLDRGDALTPTIAFTARPIIEQMISPAPIQATGHRKASPDDVARPPDASPLFATPAEEKVAMIAYGMLSSYSSLPTSRGLLSDAQQEKLVSQVREQFNGAQLGLGVRPDDVNIEVVVKTLSTAVCDKVIDVPRILLQPKGETTVTYDDVPMSVEGLRFLLPEHDIVVQELQSRVRERIAVGLPATETRIEDYVVRILIDEPDLDYDTHADLLYRRTGEAIATIRTYESDAARLHDLVAFHARSIAGKVAAHLRVYRRELPADYEPVVKDGWVKSVGRTRTAARDEPLTSYRPPVAQKSRIRQMRFVGFRRCLFSEVQFESDGERRFSVLLEDERDASIRWFRPGLQDIRIFWSAERQYQPDFIVETANERLLVEIKAPGEIDSSEVQAKARAAKLWCKHASEHTAKHDKKAWRYLLLPDEAVQFTTTLSGLVAKFG